MPGRGRKPGSIARSVFRPGDLEATGASAPDRFVLIDDIEAMTVANVYGGAVVRLGKLTDQIRRYQDVLTARAEARSRRIALIEDRLATARAWRSVHVQERYSTVLLSAGARRALHAGFASADFYIVAQAYAFVTDVPDLSLQWWLGGLLGLLVFAAGVVLARQLKALVVAQRQLAHLHGMTQPVAPELIPLEVSRPIMAGSAVIFGVLALAGLQLRIEGGEDRLGVLILTASIPLLIAAVETYLHDPLDRAGPAENWIDRLVRARRVRLEQRHERMVAALQHYLERIGASFDYERHTARIIAADLGMPCGGHPQQMNAEPEDTELTPAMPLNGHRIDGVAVDR